MALTATAVHHQLRHAAQRLRWSRLARHLLAGMAASLVLLLVFLSCDAWLHLGQFARWTGLLLFLTPLVAGVVMAWRAARPAISEASMARRLERATPGARNELINAVMFDRELAADSPMRTALFAEMSNTFPQVDWAKVLDIKLLQRIAITLGAAVLILGTWALAKPRHFNNSLARLLLPASNIAPITRTRIERIDPGNTQVSRGHKLDVSAELGGNVPAAVWLYFREAGGGWQHELMGREVGAVTFTHAWDEVRQPTEYYVAAGDSQSPVYHVSVRAKTAVASRTVEVQPPAYTHLGKNIVKDSTTLPNIVPGSKVTVSLDFNSALEDIQVADDAGTSISAAKLTDTRYQFSSVVAANRSFKTRFCDTGLVYDNDTVQFAIKVDEPPKITIDAPVEGSELQASPTGSVTIHFTTTDDFALGGVALYRSTEDNPAAELIRDWKEAAGQRTFTSQVEIPLAKYAKEDRVTFSLVAKDGNDVASTPGMTVSRPVVVTLRSAEKLAEQAQQSKAATQKSFEELIRMQEVNLSGTRAAVRDTKASVQEIPALVERQIQIADLGRTLAGSGEQIALKARQAVRELSEKEMPAAVAALRNAAASADTAQTENLLRGVQYESLILARLKGTAETATSEDKKALVRDAIAGLEELNRRQRDILGETKAAAAKGAKDLSDKQDALSTRATQVRKDLDKTSKDPSAGDADFRKRLTEVVAQFGQFRIYEDMLAAADKLQSADYAAAMNTQQGVTVNISKLIAILSQWQLAAAAREAEHLKEVAQAIDDKLGKLKNIQQQITNKSKEVARRNESKPEDAATAKEIRDLKDLMAAAVEKMLTDAEIFPDIPNANELRSILAEIFQDIQQTDLDDIAKNKKKAEEIAVQKEDGMLKGFEEAQKKTEEMEEWLPHTSETQKWLLENFDKTQFPEMPQTPCPRRSPISSATCSKRKRTSRTRFKTPPRTSSCLPAP